MEIEVESKAGWSGPAETHVSGGPGVRSKILKEHPDCGGKYYSTFLFDRESASLWGPAGRGWWCDERPKVTATIACKAIMQVMAHIWHVNERKEVGWQWCFCRNYACMSQTMMLVEKRPLSWATGRDELMKRWGTHYTRQPLGQGPSGKIVCPY